MNKSLISRIDAIISSAKSSDTSNASTYLQNEISKLKSNLGYVYEEKKFTPGEQPSEDHMIVSLLSQVVKAVKEEEEESGKTSDEQGRTERIVKTLEWHKSRLLQRQEEIQKEKVEIAAEQKKYITSEDIHDGWDSKTVSKDIHLFSLWDACADRTTPIRLSRQLPVLNRNLLLLHNLCLHRARKRKRQRLRPSTRLVFRQPRL